MSGSRVSALNLLGRPAPPAAAVEPATTPSNSALFGLVLGVVVVASLFFAREVLLPITLAAMLSFLLAPLVRLLRRVHLGRVGSVLLAMLVALGIFVSLGGVIGRQVASLADDIPRYQSTVQHKIRSVQTMATRGMAFVLRNYGRNLTGSPPATAAADNSGGDKTPKAQLVQVAEPPPSPLLLAERIITPILSPLASVGIIIVVALFLLLQQQDLRDRMIRLFGSRDLHRTTIAIDDAAQRLSRYFLTQLGINACFGVVIGGGLAIIGVPSPILWGVIATLLRFVPYFGSPLASLPPIILAAAVVPGWSMVIETALLFLIVEAIVGQAIEPMLYGSSTGLSPFSVIVAAIFWSWLWGPIGLILSTPLTLCLVVLGRHVDRLEFLDVLLGDRPALTPIESFYQRMLANDPDEALAQAELLLKERSLSSYYDEVALKGLVLAANDAERGVLKTERLVSVTAAMRSLIEELAERDDTEPPEDTRARSSAQDSADDDDPPHALPPLDDGEPLAAAFQTAQPVLCIAGRGPFDELAAEMLAQLLTKHRLGARVVQYEAASRANMGSLDLTDVAMVCVTYLSPDATRPSMRYLLGRLRRRLPGVPLVVGLWDAESPLLADPALRSALGADLCAASLRDTVEACLEAAHAATTTTQVLSNAAA